jgi:transposase
MTQKKMELDIINPNCAGIDIGSKSHFVAVGQALEDVKEFGVYADDLIAICLHLREYGITSVAMESTGNYWQNLYVELERHGKGKLPFAMANSPSMPKEKRLM